MNNSVFWITAILIVYFCLRWLGIQFVKKYDWTRWYYQIYLKSWHWKFLRWRKITWAFIFKGKVACEKCGSTKNIIIHHITYEHIGHERLSDLQLICMAHHRRGGGKI